MNASFGSVSVESLAIYDFPGHSHKHGLSSAQLPCTWPCVRDAC